MLLAQFYLDRRLTSNIYLGGLSLCWQRILANKYVGLILLRPVGDNAIVTLDAKDADLFKEGRKQDVA